MGGEEQAADGAGGPALRGRAQSIHDRVKDLEEARARARTDEAQAAEPEDTGEADDTDSIEVVMRRYKAAWQVCTPEQQEYYRTYWRQVFGDDPSMRPPGSAGDTPPEQQLQPKPDQQQAKKKEPPQDAGPPAAAAAPAPAAAAAAPAAPAAAAPAAPEPAPAAAPASPPPVVPRLAMPAAPQPTADRGPPSTAAQRAPTVSGPRADPLADRHSPPSAPPSVLSARDRGPPRGPYRTPRDQLRTPRDRGLSGGPAGPPAADTTAPLPPSFFLGLGAKAAPDPREFARAWRQVGEDTPPPAQPAPAPPPAHVDPEPARSPPPQSWAVAPGRESDDDDDDDDGDAGASGALAPGLLQFIDTELAPGSPQGKNLQSLRRDRCGTGPKRSGGAAPRGIADVAEAAGALLSTGAKAHTVPTHRVLQTYLTRPNELRHYLDAVAERRPRRVAVHRRKMILVGAGEAGKTSLMKCFAHTPLFFKALPTVGTTCGIDVQWHRVPWHYNLPFAIGDQVVRADGRTVAEPDELGDGRGWLLRGGERATVMGISAKGNLELRNPQGRVSGMYLLAEDYRRAQSPLKEGEAVDVAVMDFAGQEVYHSHSLFLSARALYLFVWDMSRADADGSGGALSAEEERRLKGWADLVQAKAPGGSIVLVGTHKDMLRDTSTAGVASMLGGVLHILEGYLESLAGRAGRQSGEYCVVHGAHAVSCKDFTASPMYSRIKDLFRGLAEDCLRQAQADPVFPDGEVPREVISLIDTLEAIKRAGDTIVIPLSDYKLLAQRVGVHAADLEKVTRLLHDWDVLYLFDRQGLEGLERQDCVFLHPRWLAQLVATVFTYVHACAAPKHEKDCMVIPPNIDVECCDAADPTKRILDGVLGERDLAPSLFAGSLRELRREPTRANVDLCLTMLANLDIVYRAPADDEPDRSYYVPSLFHITSPPGLTKHVARLFRRRGSHLGFLLTPFPKEVLHMLHCRLHPLVARLYARSGDGAKATSVTLERTEVTERLGLCFDAGAPLVLTGVLAGTPGAAAELGAYRGWRVTHAAGREVDTRDELAEASRGRLRITLRVAPPQPEPSLRNNWENAWWLGGGGGGRGGEGMGKGPVRALAVADVAANAPHSGGRIDVYSVEPAGHDSSGGRLGADGLSERFAEALVELLYKFPGVTLTGTRTRTRAEDPEMSWGGAADACLPQDTFDELLKSLQPNEAAALLRGLGWELSARQAEKLRDAGPCGLSQSDLLDNFVRGQMARWQAAYSDL